MEAANDFFRCGEPAGGAKSQNVVPYSLETDSAAIITAFQREYGIDLTTTKMHWWRFSALLRGLLEHSFSERVKYRTCDLGKIKNSEMRSQCSHLKQLYELDSHGRKIQRPTTVEEYNAMIMAQIRGEDYACKG